jgi:CzcA family heavy metal efflux pump
MFNALIDWSARNRFIVVVLAAVLIIGGSLMSLRSDIDVLPEFAPPQVIVQTEAPGLVAEEVETLVSFPLEAALNGTPGVSFVKSISMTGISHITVIFQYGTDIFTARQLVNERIQTARGRLPQTAQSPVLLPVMSAVADILKIGLVSETTSAMDLRTIADWQIRSRILAVPGVSRVLVMGGDVKQFQVLIDPEKLKSFGITLDQVRIAVQKSNVVAPAGVMVTSDKQFPIRGLARVGDLNDIRNSVILNRGDVPVLVRHVARVEVGPAFKIGDAVINGKPGVEIIISRQPWVNTVDVTRRVEKALAELKHGLPNDIQFITIFRQANFIERSVSNVIWSIATGGFLVTIVLLFFLSNWRSALISLTAIPLSLLSAILIIKATGGSINTMTLGGLAIAVGEVVDDAIVDVENVYRRLREARLKKDSRSSILIILDACKEVRSSVVYATFVVALVFLPVFCLSGTEGKIFGPLGFSYVVATMSSLLVALVVTPAMCVYLLGKGRSVAAHEPPMQGALKGLYSGVLNKVLGMPRLVLLSAMLLFLGSASLLPWMGQEFLPQFQEEALIVSATGLAGESLEATTRMGIALEQKLLQHKEVVAVGQRAGRTELDDDAGGPNFSEFDIQVNAEKAKLEVILDDIRKHLDELPGVATDVGSFIKHRMDDVLSGGTRAQIAIKIFGPDLNVLRSLAGKVDTELKAVKGAVDVRPEALVLMPEITVKINRDRAARYGITADDLSQSLETAFNGVVVSQVLEGQKLFALKVWIQEQSRHNLNMIKSLMIDTPGGMLIPLSQVADVGWDETPNAVIRENVARRIVVQANTSGRDVGSVVKDAQARISKIALPPGYYIMYSGEYAAQQEAMQSLLAWSLLAFVGILVLLRQGLHSWKSTLLVSSNLPLAMIGGIIAVSLTGNVISIGSLIGFISLFGISTRNSLLLVTHINDLEVQGLPFAEAVFKGCLDRVTPVLMTALTAALGMLPLALLGGSGRELEQPLAIVIVGGLVSSTALTLIVIPALFHVFSSPQIKRQVGSRVS